MVLLNVVYGLYVALAALCGLSILGFGMAWYEFVAIWAIWTAAQVLYDVTAYYLVKLFNRNRIFTREDFNNLRRP